MTEGPSTRPVERYTLKHLRDLALCTLVEYFENQRAQEKVTLRGDFSVSEDVGPYPGITREAAEVARKVVKDVEGLLKIQGPGGEGEERDEAADEDIEAILKKFNVPSGDP